MKLTNENISETVEKIQNLFEKAAVSLRDRTKIILIVEESLIRCRDHFGEEKDFELKMNQWFGGPNS